MNECDFRTKNGVGCDHGGICLEYVGMECEARPLTAEEEQVKREEQSYEHLEAARLYPMNHRVSLKG